MIKVVKVAEGVNKKVDEVVEGEMIGNTVVDRRKRLKDLIVYQRMMELVRIVYSLSIKLPHTEDFGLKSQMKRAAVSIIACFAEGYMRKSIKDKLHFLEMSDTSHDELDTEADVCQELSFWSREDWSLYLAKSSEVSYLASRYQQAIVKS